ncbi:hypothetical protein E1B28_005766 [Marasmius oreades]|uniref:DUF6593 domain-containing protein n=1 Tax=Marasmius oreades TaxID=181124 RepID=A0A9P7S462_9AGAR|nr:uncharacterized protein E1B28_005766 [Marasmius oreades]KAG7094965.1 hypothetical protein E1B28_005766 [Marasmius oreades]
MSVNPFSSWNSGFGGSVYGALPTSGPASTASSLMSFVFTQFNPNILNCTVVGSNGQPHFYVFTDASLPNFTILKRSDGRPFGVIEWRNHPVVEIKDLVKKQFSSQFLHLSQDQRSRTMTIDSREYVWVPQTNQVEAIWLYRANLPQSPPLARIIKSGSNIHLELNPEAIQAGLLQPCLLSVVLLHSGRQID